MRACQLTGESIEDDFNLTEGVFCNARKCFSSSGTITFSHIILQITLKVTALGFNLTYMWTKQKGLVHSTSFKGITNKHGVILKRDFISSSLPGT